MPISHEGDHLLSVRMTDPNLVPLVYLGLYLFLCCRLVLDLKKDVIESGAPEQRGWKSGRISGRKLT